MLCVFKFYLVSNMRYTRKIYGGDRGHQEEACVHFKGTRPLPPDYLVDVPMVESKNPKASLGGRSCVRQNGRHLAELRAPSTDGVHIN